MISFKHFSRDCSAAKPAVSPVPLTSSPAASGGSLWAVSAAVSLLLASWPGHVMAQDVPQLIRAAFAHHPLLRSQQGRQDAAKAGVDAARWQFWPTPSISAERAAVSGANLANGANDLVTTLRLQQPLWTGGRLSGNLTRAEARALAAEADFQDAKQQLALRVTQAWSEVLVAQYKLSAYEASLVKHRRLLALVQRRQAEGASAMADVALARSRLGTLQSELDAVVAQRDTALDRLRSLTGRTLLPGDFAQSRQPELPSRKAGLAQLLEAAQTLSPLLSKARSQTQVAQAEVDIARAALSPEVYVRVEQQFGGVTQNQKSSQSRVFVGLNSSFGSGLSSFSGVDTALAQKRAALEDEQVQQLSVQEQVQADFTLAQAAQTRLVGLEESRRATVDVSDSYERQFLEGRKQWQDLLNAAREQTQSEVQLADAIGARQLANWRLAIYSRGIDDVVNSLPAAQPLVTN